MKRPFGRAVRKTNIHYLPSGHRNDRSNLAAASQPRSFIQDPADYALGAAIVVCVAAAIIFSAFVLLFVG